MERYDHVILVHHFGRALALRYIAEDAVNGWIVHVVQPCFPLRQCISAISMATTEIVDFIRCRIPNIGRDRRPCRSEPVDLYGYAPARRSAATDRRRSIFTTRHYSWRCSDASLTCRKHQEKPSWLCPAPTPRFFVSVLHSPGKGNNVPECIGQYMFSKFFISGFRFKKC